MTEIFCPCCEGVLEITHRDHYQDLSEHVSEPNRKPSLKDGYQCINTECIANKADVSWIKDGDCYFGKRPDSISYSELSNALKERTGHCFAINSWNYHYQLGKDAIKKKTIKINLYWLVFNIYPTEKGGNYPLETQYQPHPWKRKVEIWKHEGEHSYTNVIPFWRMTSFQLKNFKRAYKRWKETGNNDSYSLEECYKISQRIHYRSKDNRFYARVTSFILKTFHPFKVAEIERNYISK